MTLSTSPAAPEAATAADALAPLRFPSGLRLTPDQFALLCAAASSQPDVVSEVFPTLMRRILTWHSEQPHLDIGTPQVLAAAQELLSKR